MKDALEAVESVRAAAKEFGLKRWTLQNRVNGKHMGKRGALTKFTLEEEKDLEELLTSCAAMGVPVSPILFRKVVRNAVIAKGMLIFVFNRLIA